MACHSTGLQLQFRFISKQRWLTCRKWITFNVSTFLHRRLGMSEAKPGTLRVSPLALSRTGLYLNGSLSFHGCQGLRLEMTRMESSTIRLGEVSNFLRWSSALDPNSCGTLTSKRRYVKSVIPQSSTGQLDHPSCSHREGRFLANCLFHLVTASGLCVPEKVGTIRPVSSYNSNLRTDTIQLPQLSFVSIEIGSASYRHSL